MTQSQFWAIVLAWGAIASLAAWTFCQMVPA